MPQFKMSPNLSHGLSKNSAIFNAIFAAYVEAIYWTDTEHDSDDKPSPDTAMAESTIFECMGDCADMLRQTAAHGLIDAYAQSGQNWEQFGHDFWLTRNGHGAGFWDRSIGKLGDDLSSIARDFGSVSAYAGDDGLLYIE